MRLIQRITPQRWPSGMCKAMGLFLCKCGAKVERPLYAGLRFNSCGCQQTPFGKRNPKYRHGASNTRVYYVWNGMITRCSNPKHKDYHIYGGRGIKVCAQWRKAANFIRWALRSGYEKGLLLDRRNPDGNYSPRNCRWVTPLENNLNRRLAKAKLMTASLVRDLYENGVSRHRIAEITGVSYDLVKLIVRGKIWNPELWNKPIQERGITPE